MKKGFTLAELMGVIVIMAVLALIIVPVVDKQLREGKKDIYNSTIDSIKSSLDLYMTNINLANNDYMMITLYQLKQAGYVDIDIKNPVSNELFPNDMLITILNDNGILKYSINDESGTNKRNYESIPKIVLNGNVLEYVELGDTYNESDANSSYNGVVLDTVIESSIDTNEVGVYTVTYTASYENISNKAIKTVIVRDTTSPTIDFETLNISLSSAKTYDYTSDITVYDKSGSDEVEVKVEKNFGALIGTYSVKYIATDKYGNETIKYRKVITS